jgi:hypothetical protein
MQRATTPKCIKKERQKYKWRGHKPKAPLNSTKSKVRYT